MVDCKSGIYAIVNTLTGRRYIGSSVDMRKRFASHRCALDKGTHGNPKLKSAWKRHGAEAFEFVPLEYVPDVTQLYVREQWYLDQYIPHVYNHGPIASHPLLGTTRDESTKRLIGASKVGKKRAPFSDEWRARLGEAKRGKYNLSAEMTASIAAKNTGQKRSDETREKQREAWKHKVITPKWRDSMRANAAHARNILLAKTHCRNGHSYEGAYSQKGARRCRTCQALAVDRYRARKKQAVA